MVRFFDIFLSGVLSETFNKMSEKLKIFSYGKFLNEPFYTLHILLNFITDMYLHTYVCMYLLYLLKQLVVWLYMEGEIILLFNWSTWLSVELDSQLPATGIQNVSFSMN